MGGISEAVKVCAMASVHARPVIPHVFPEIQVHLAAGLPTVSAVEMTVPEYEIDIAYRLFSDWIRIEAGSIVAPTRPGDEASFVNGASVPVDGGAAARSYPTTVDPVVLAGRPDPT